MSEDNAIVIRDVHKSFRLPHEQYSSLKNRLLHIKNHKKGYEDQHVLKGISFEIKKGEFFGIVGRNGSGKSTLLKLMAGVYVPDKGDIHISGTLSPFIELGVGFNQELTGRENVFLNGALLGFNRKQMKEMYDEIVDFAELEEFMDQKLKNYSSGMQVRLAFSIAIRAKGDILLLDEVLAVGDAVFQKKCMDIFERYKASRKTIVLVTHSMDMVERFCSRAMMLDQGMIKSIGSPASIADEYTESNLKATKKDIVEKKEHSTGGSSRISLKIKDYQANEATFKSGDTMQVEVSWPENTEGVKNVSVAIFKNSGEFIFGSNTMGRDMVLDSNRISYEVALPLSPGKYRLASRLFGESREEIVDRLDDGPEFMIIEQTQQSKVNGQQNGLVRLEHRWYKE